MLKITFVALIRNQNSSLFPDLIFDAIVCDPPAEFLNQAAIQKSTLPVCKPELLFTLKDWLLADANPLALPVTLLTPATLVTPAMFVRLLVPYKSARLPLGSLNCHQLTNPNLAGLNFNDADRLSLLGLLPNRPLRVFAPPNVPER